MVTSFPSVSSSAAALHRALPAELLLSAIVDSSDDAIVSKSLDGTITSWNRAAERIFGFRAEEMIGRSILQLVPPQLHRDEELRLQRMRGGERVEHYESVRLRKDGTPVSVSLSVSPVRTAGGAVIGASMVIRDITQQRKSAETAFLLAAIVESSDDAIASKDLTGTITSWNKAAERIFGYTSAEMVGQSVLRLIPPELQHEEPIILSRLQRGERVDHYETTRVRKDGRRITVSLTISPIRNADGTIVGASKVARDITAQREADQAVRLLAAIVDSSDDAILSQDLQGIVTSWNRGAERVFGYTASEMIGQSIAKLFPRDRLDEEPRIMDRLKRGERVDHYHTVRVRKDGGVIDVSLSVSPLRDAAGVVVGASKVARDITREKQAMARLALAHEELRRADRMKSEFLAVMSHELRTPLNSIIGFASVLRQGRSGPVTDDQKKQLNLIHASGKHLLNLINDLLDLSRIEAGRMDIEREEFAAKDVIQEAVRTLELQIAQKQLEVATLVDPDGAVFTDRKRFYQVVLNLLNNAIKFTPRGRIEVRATREGDVLTVAVSDTGIGIAKEKQSELFQAFTQVEGSARRRYEGTGLGLYLCRKIVTLLGGEIGLHSELNRGSTFTFRIPVGPLPPPTAKETETPPRA